MIFSTRDQCTNCMFFKRCVYHPNVPTDNYTSYSPNNRTFDTYIPTPDPFDSTEIYQEETKENNQQDFNHNNSHRNKQQNDLLSCLNDLDAREQELLNFLSEITSKLDQIRASKSQIQAQLDPNNYFRYTEPHPSNFSQIPTYTPNYNFEQVQQQVQYPSPGLSQPSNPPTQNPTQLPTQHLVGDHIQEEEKHFGDEVSDNPNEMDDEEQSTQLSSNKPPCSFTKNYKKTCVYVFGNDILNSTADDIKAIYEAEVYSNSQNRHSENDIRAYIEKYIFGKFKPHGKRYTQYKIQSRKDIQKVFHEGDPQLGGSSLAQVVRRMFYRYLKSNSFQIKINESDERDPNTKFCYGIPHNINEIIMVFEKVYESHTARFVFEI